MKDIYDAYIDENIVNNSSFKFNIELGDYKVYDQKESFTCWIFAGFNLIKKEVAEKMGISENDFDFSLNYVSFFDRYEKLELLYNKLIVNDYKKEEIKSLLLDYINTCGNFDSFKYLIKKYGIVFESQMPICDNNYIPNDINKLLKEKILFDVEKICNLKEDKDTKKLLELKDTMMKENYDILCEIFGQPPTKCEYNINSKSAFLAPMEFSKLYINDILNEYKSIISYSTLSYNQKYIMDFNIPNFQKTEYLNLSKETIKKAILKSLKDKCPVWFGCSYRYMSGSYKNTYGILYSNLYNFSKINIKKLDTNLAEKYNFLNYDHAMIFVGANVENNIVNRWKVLNSFGIYNNRKGYFVMDDKFFDENVFLFAIKEKYI